MKGKLLFSFFIVAFFTTLSIQAESITVDSVLVLYGPDTLITKRQIKYDETGNILADYYYSLDKSTSDWKGYGAYENKYDNSGELILTINYKWDDSNSSWINNYKKEYAYDEKGCKLLDAMTAKVHWSKNLRKEARILILKSISVMLPTEFISFGHLTRINPVRPR
jgi:hypothetical protein